MANRIMSPSHFSRTFLGLYEPGQIKKLLASNEYKKSVSQNETVCPYCDYNLICKENGMVQPSELNGKFHQNEPFCMAVLDMIGPKEVGRYGCLN